MSNPSRPSGSGLLFVAGQGRSGTTALLRVLSAHPQVALGIERYKALWASRIGELSESSFTRERFFDFGDGLTNITPDSSPFVADHYGRLAERWSSAAYRGDKMVALRMRAMWETMPAAQFICIVRDAVDVAASWQRRADDPHDAGWPATAGAARAIARWNTAAGRILRAARERPNQVTVVEYGRFFADPDANSLHALMGRLHLDMTPDVSAVFAASHASYLQLPSANETGHVRFSRHLVDENLHQHRWSTLQDLAV